MQFERYPETGSPLSPAGEIAWHNAPGNMNVPPVNILPIKSNLGSLSDSMAPLPFTRHPIVIPIHLRAGAVLQKKVASSHEVICEQWVLPSHLYCALFVGRSLPEVLLGVSTFPIFDDTGSSEPVFGFSPIMITGDVDSG